METSIALTPFETALLAEILAIEQRIRTLGTDKTVRQRWGLSGMPLKPMIGGDMESYAYHREEGNKIGFASNTRQFHLVTRVFELCANELCKKPFEDSNALELNPKPGSAAQIIQTYQNLGRLITPAADDLGWDFAMGDGHWHFSLQEIGGKHLLTRTEDFVHSSFAINLGNNHVALQCLCPALFLRPSRSEKPQHSSVNTAYVGAYSGRLEYGWKARTVRIGPEHYPDGGSNFEIRMSYLAPYLPVLLLLHAAERTLLGHNINVADYNQETVTLADGSNFLQGKGCYFDYLSTTEQSGYLKQHFPHLRELLLDACVKGYERYLENPAWSVRYNQDEREKTLDRLYAKYPQLLAQREPTRESVVSTSGQAARLVA